MFLDAKSTIIDVVNRFLLLYDYDRKVSYTFIQTKISNHKKNPLVFKGWGLFNNFLSCSVVNCFSPAYVDLTALYIAKVCLAL